MTSFIHSENTNDVMECIKIIRWIKKKIKKLYGHNVYDFKLIYNKLKNKTAIPVRKNSSTLPKGPPYRCKVTRFIKRFNEKLWKIKNNYGLRWNIEIYFPGMKRLFGETVRAVKPECIIQEIMLNVYFYNEYNKLSEGY